MKRTLSEKEVHDLIDIYASQFKSEKNWKGDINLNEFIISGIVLKEVNVESISAVGSEFINVTFQKLVFLDSSMNLSKFDSCSFSEVDFSKSIMHDTKFEKCVFSNCKFSGTEIICADISDCEFVNCDFFNITFSDNYLRNTTFINIKNMKTGAIADNTEENVIWKECT